MTHTQILKQLSAARKTHLIERSDRAGLIHLALYLGALAISTTAIVVQVPFWGRVCARSGRSAVFSFHAQP